MTSAAYSSCSELADSLLSESSCLLVGSFLDDDHDHPSSPSALTTLASSSGLQEASTPEQSGFGCGGRTSSDACSVPVMLFRQQLLVEQRLVAELPAADSCSRAAYDAGIRMIVVSWLVEVAEEFGLQQETFHKAVLLLDRFMASSEAVPRCVLQLLAVACIMLAAKDLEVFHPTVEQLCRVTADHFKAQDLLRMERIILNVLDFRVAGPSTYTFLHLLAQACSSWLTPSVLSLAMYLCELAMLDSKPYLLAQVCSSSSYGHTAASALLLAQLSLGSAQHTPFIKVAVADCLGAACTLQEMLPCMALLLRLQQIAYQHTLAALSAAASMGSSTGHIVTTNNTAPDLQAPCTPAGEAPQPDDLLAPLRVKFAAACWCGVSTAPPLALLPLQV